jgi:hypothetical protein
MKYLLALMLIGCSQGTKTAPSAEPSSPTASASSAAPTATASASASAKAPTQKVSSLSVFDGQVLSVCLQFTTEPQPGIEPKPTKKPDNIVISEQSCAETFPGKLSFATCDIADTSIVAKQWPDDSRRLVSVQAFYYQQPKVFDNDVELKQCLDWKGKWQPIAKDSPEYKQWEHEERAKRIGKLTDTLAP